MKFCSGWWRQCFKWPELTLFQYNSKSRNPAFLSESAEIYETAYLRSFFIQKQQVNKKTDNNIKKKLFWMNDKCKSSGHLFSGIILWMLQTLQKKRHLFETDRSQNGGKDFRQNFFSC